MTTRPIRCAVYTRKSSEEGLDQAFNSLDAQREAGSDYIKSQKHQGWVALDARYDDGGFSGGSTDRPGLQRLINDVESGRVDVVVVYKVDRLSRSLADFARIMQLFDERKVSFVSVTQQFNTTTSMGRLTLNMLLSFAQFEREVSGERIRDKIVATKRKGVWVCGQPPQGYRLARPGTGEDRRLWVVDAEARVVRAVFEAYLETGSLLQAAASLNAAGHTTKRWVSTRGVAHGGRRFDPQSVHRTLTNPVYIGQLTHTRGGKTEVFPGLHEPIVDRRLWDRVRAQMTEADRQARHRWTHTHLLKGKMRTHEGYLMSPTSVTKPVRVSGRATSQTRSTRYYVSQKAVRQGFKTCPIRSINGGYMDDLVRAIVLEFVRRERKADLAALEPEARDHAVRECIKAVTLAPERLTIELGNDGVEAGVQLVRSRAQPSEPKPQAGGAKPRRAQAVGPASPPAAAFKTTVERRDDGVTLTIQAQIRRIRGHRALVSPDGHDLLLTAPAAGAPRPNDHIVRAVGLAFHWRRELLKPGATIDAAAQRAGFAPARAHYLLRLTQLGPAALRAILTGALPPHLKLQDLVTAAALLDWAKQDAFLGLAPKPKRR